MGYKISVTDLAVQDLDTIVEYISGELGNPTAASAFLDAVDACYENLASMPLMCAMKMSSRSVLLRRVLASKLVPPVPSPPTPG